MVPQLPAGWTPPIAERQAGVFTPAQARAAGATEAQVKWRRRSGAWSVVVGSAVALAETARTPWTDAFGAALTVPQATLAMQSAARLHRLPVADDGLVHVHVPARTRARERLVTHRYRLEPHEVASTGVGVVRVTDLPRTLHDCIGRLPQDQSESLLAYAIGRQLVHPDIARRWTDPPYRGWGDTARREAAAAALAGAASAAERRLHGILRGAHITGWRANATVRDAGGVIGSADVLFAAEKVVLEADGQAYHGPEVFQRDRERQNRMMMAGYLVLRFTWQDLTDRPDQVTDQFRRALTMRRPAGRDSPPPGAFWYG